MRVTLVDDGVHPWERHAGRSQVGRRVADVSGKKSVAELERRPLPCVSVQCSSAHSDFACLKTFSFISCPRLCPVGGASCGRRPPPALGESSPLKSSSSFKISFSFPSVP